MWGKRKEPDSNREPQNNNQDALTQLPDLPEDLTNAARAARENCLRRCGLDEAVFERLTISKAVDLALARVESGRSSAAAECLYLQDMIPNPQDLAKELRPRLSKAVLSGNATRAAAFVGLVSELPFSTAVILMNPSLWSGKHFLAGNERSHAFLQKLPDETFRRFVSLVFAEQTEVKERAIEKIAGALKRSAKERRISTEELIDYAFEASSYIRNIVGDKKNQTAQSFGVRVALALTYVGEQKPEPLLMHFYKYCVEAAPSEQKAIEEVRRSAVIRLRRSYGINTEQWLLNLIDRHNESPQMQAAVTRDYGAVLKEFDVEESRSKAAERGLYLMRHSSAVVRQQYLRDLTEGNTPKPNLAAIEEGIENGITFSNLRPLACALWFSHEPTMKKAVLHVLSRTLLSEMEWRALGVELEEFIATPPIRPGLPGTSNNLKSAIIDAPLLLLGSAERPDTQVLRENYFNIVDVASRLSDGNFILDHFYHFFPDRDGRSAAIQFAIVRAADMVDAFPFGESMASQLHIQPLGESNSVREILKVPVGVLRAARKVVSESMDCERAQRLQEDLIDRINGDSSVSLVAVQCGAVAPRAFLDSLRERSDGEEFYGVYSACVRYLVGKLTHSSSASFSTQLIQELVRDDVQSVVEAVRGVVMESENLASRSYSPKRQIINYFAGIESAQFLNFCTAIAEQSKFEEKECKAFALFVEEIAAQRGMHCRDIEAEVIERTANAVLSTRISAHLFCRKLAVLSADFTSESLRLMYVESPNSENAIQTAQMLASHYPDDARGSFLQVAKGRDFSHETREDAFKRWVSLGDEASLALVAQLILSREDPILTSFAWQSISRDPTRAASVLSRMFLEEDTVRSLDMLLAEVAPDTRPPSVNHRLNVCNILEEIGLAHLLEWASRPQEPLRSNSRSLLDYYMQNSGIARLETELERALTSMRPEQATARNTIIQAARTASDSFERFEISRDLPS